MARPPINSSLLIAFAVAFSLHALLLSFLQLRRRPQPGPDLLRARDNTPELLEFSSLPSRLAHVDVLSLPKASLLPPPPVLLPAPGRTRSPSPSASSALARLRMIRPSVSLKSKDSSHGRAARSSAEGTKSMVGSRSATLTSPSPTDLTTQDWDEALERLNRLRRDGQSQSMPELNLATNPSTNATEQTVTWIQSSELPQYDRYQALWNLARPISPQRKEQAVADRLALEVRQITLQNLRSQEVELRHGQIVGLRDKLLLFWIQAEKIYVVKASIHTTNQP